jgi:hypothetical protein
LSSTSLAAQTAVLLEFADGRTHAYVFSEQAEAFRWYRWHGNLAAASSFTFYRRVPGGAARDVISGSDVVSVDLVSRAKAMLASEIHEAFFGD